MASQSPGGPLNLINVNYYFPRSVDHYSFNENARMSHLPPVHGVENSPQQIWPWPWPMTFDLDPCDIWPWYMTITLTFDLDLSDLDLDTRDLDLGLPFLILGWKLRFLHFWPWPLTYNLDLQTLPRYDRRSVKSCKGDVHLSKGKQGAIFVTELNQILFPLQ